MANRSRKRRSNPQTVVSSFLKLPLWLKIAVIAALIAVVAITYFNRPQVVMPTGELHVTILDVGNADSILLQTEQATMLIDAGERGDGETVLDALRERGITTLDHVIATHADSDHIGGMQTVLEGVTVKNYIMAFMPTRHTPTTQTYENVIETVDRLDIPLTEAVVGHSFMLGEATVEIIGPVHDFEENNDQSVVCKVTFGEKTFLFMGDAEKDAESALLATPTDLSADVLKVSHHGSATGTSAEFLTRVNPQIALITCGADNKYGHPHEEVLQRLQTADITTYRSDVNGIISLRCDGKTITVTPERGEAA